MEIFECGDVASPRRKTRRSGSRRDLSPTRFGGDASQAGRGRANCPEGRQKPQTGDHGRLRPVLQGRHRQGICSRHARNGRPDHDGRPCQMESTYRGTGLDELQRHRRLQAQRLDAGAGDAPGVEHSRKLRSQVDGLQQPEIYSYDLSGDESGVCRPRFLLRRHIRKTCRSGRDAALERVRERACKADKHRPQRPHGAAGRSVQVSKQGKSIRRSVG